MKSRKFFTLIISLAVLSALSLALSAFPASGVGEDFVPDGIFNDSIWNAGFTLVEGSANEYYSKEVGNRPKESFSFEWQIQIVDGFVNIGIKQKEAPTAGTDRKNASSVRVWLSRNYKPLNGDIIHSNSFFDIIYSIGKSKIVVNTNQKNSWEINADEIILGEKVDESSWNIEISIPYSELDNDGTTVSDGISPDNAFGINITCGSPFSLDQCQVALLNNKANFDADDLLTFDMYTGLTVSEPQPEISAANPSSPENIPSGSSTVITAEKPSEYMISYPAQTSVNGPGKTALASPSLKVTGNTEMGKNVTVTASAEDLILANSAEKLPFKLLDGNNNVFTSAVWSSEEVRSGTKEVALFVSVEQSDWDNAKAGSYSGKITFTASLK